MLATAGAALVLLARGVVQLTLFEHDATGWLAVTRIAMGYPLYVAAIGFAFWVVRRARHQLSAEEPANTPA
jgi:TRAP-type C4-dicarboxylate transport system permease small subunit